MARPGAALVLERHARVYRRTWRGSVISTFLNPILFLVAMGIGLGQLVDQGGGSAELPFSYLEFLAPGLLAAAAMQNGANDSAWPVMAGMKWVKFYDTALNTPVTTRDLVQGRFAWTGLQLAFSSIVFVVIMALFGAVDPARGALAVFPAILTGLAFAGPITAFTAQLERESGLTALFRFGITPIFLFSGTFFPIEQLPDWMEPIAFITPLWHGVELTRGITLGIPTAWAPIWHVLFLATCFVVGAMVAARNYHRRLVS